MYHFIWKKYTHKTVIRKAGHGMSDFIGWKWSQTPDPIAIRILHGRCLMPILGNTMVQELIPLKKKNLDTPFRKIKY